MSSKKWDPCMWIYSVISVDDKVFHLHGRTWGLCFFIYIVIENIINKASPLKKWGLQDKGDYMGEFEKIK
jgi:hypothetical protein